MRSFCAAQAEPKETTSELVILDYAHCRRRPQRWRVLALPAELLFKPRVRLIVLLSRFACPVYIFGLVLQRTVFTTGPGLLLA